MKSKILCLKRNCWENIVWTQLLHVPLVLIPKLSPTKVEFMTCFHEFSEYESTKFFHQILRNIFLNFIKCSKMRKKTLLANNNFLFLELLLKKFVDSHSRNAWKHVMNSLKDSKFVEYAQNIFQQSAKDGLKLALVMLPFDLG